MPEFDKKSEVAPEAEQTPEPSTLTEVAQTSEASAEESQAPENQGVEGLENTEAPIIEEPADGLAKVPAETAVPAPKPISRRGRRGGGFKGAASTKITAAGESSAAMVEVSSGVAVEDAISARVVELGDALKDTEERKPREDSKNSNDSERRKGRRGSEDVKGGRRERPRRESRKAQNAGDDVKASVEKTSEDFENPSKRRERSPRKHSDSKIESRKPNSKTRTTPLAEPVRMDFTQKPKSEGIFGAIKSAISGLFGGSSTEPVKAPAKKGARNGSGRGKGRSGPSGRSRSGQAGPKSGKPRGQSEGNRPRGKEGSGRRRGPRRRGGNNRREGSSGRPQKSEVES